MRWFDWSFDLDNVVVEVCHVKVKIGAADIWGRLVGRESHCRWSTSVDVILWW